MTNDGSKLSENSLDEDQDQTLSFYTKEAVLFEIGIDRPNDYERAYDMWAKAASLGHIYARARCQELEAKGLIKPRKSDTNDENSNQVGMSTKNTKILFVDDDKEIIELAEQILSRVGYTPILATNGEEALQQVGKHPDIRMVFTDLNMPKMNGFHFLNYIRQMSMLEGIPIIVCTGYVENQLLHKLKKYRVAGCLLKPFQSDDLCNSINKYL